MEENKTVSFDKVKIKLKVEEAKRKVKEGAKTAVNWCVQNKELALGIAAGGVAGIKLLSKIHSSRQDERDHELKHWDPRAGEYARSRRKLTRHEKLELIERYQAGEDKYHILDDMGLLK